MRAENSFMHDAWLAVHPGSLAGTLGQLLRAV
jgi:hypothetical protein